MIDVVSVVVTTKEAECLMWGLAQIGDHTNRFVSDPSDPLFILLAEGFTRQAIAEACENLFAHCYARTLALPLTELESTIVRLSVENSSWVHHYQLHNIDVSFVKVARQALRSLAAKLDTLGIEINILPQD